MVMKMTHHKMILVEKKEKKNLFSDQMGAKLHKTCMPVQKRSFSSQCREWFFGHGVNL